MKNIDLRENAEKQIKSEMTPIRYDTREYPVEVIVDKFKNEEFIVPKYQREFVWNEEKQSKFIESVLLDLPIPFIYFADEPVTGKLEIVDGSQRVRTLHAFVGGKLMLEKLQKLDELNGFVFSDLLEPRQRRFLRKTIRSVELTEDASWNIRKDIFERINTKPYDLTPMEIRKGMFEGAFYDFIKKCSEKELFRSLCPISDKKLKREEAPEMVLRFFAYANNYQKFVHRVSDFMDDFMADKTKNGFNEEQFEHDFSEMLTFVDTHFPYGFKKTATDTSTPRVRFETIAVGTHLALIENPSLGPQDNVETWLNSDEFKTHTTSDGSNSKTKLIARIEYVKNKLLGK